MSFDDKTIRFWIFVQWAIWIGLVFIHLLGFVSSSGTTVPLRLVKGNSVEILVFRPFPDPLHLQLVFEKQSGVKRPELGGQRHIATDGGFRFDSPGEPVKLQVTSNGTSTVFEMFPGGNLAFEERHDKAVRDFMPFVKDDDPAVFPWPPANNLRPVLSSGLSRLTISVLETGPLTAGELVTLDIGAPINPKTVHTQSYLWLGSLMLLWPINIILLLLYGVFLLKKTIKT